MTDSDATSANPAGYISYVLVFKTDGIGHSSTKAGSFLEVLSVITVTDGQAQSGAL